tara:strand:+ start:279 stop:518 length:240 start_codon:yes stop_codon:yes gene_type:complete
MTIEGNIKKSFQGVKIDIISIKNQILQLAESQRELAHMIAKSQKPKSKKSSGKTKAVKKKVVKKAVKKKVVKKKAKKKR